VAGNACGQQSSRCVMRYLADSSALWRLLRDSEVRAGWADVISDHAIGSCQPQRPVSSLGQPRQYEQMTDVRRPMSDVPVPKTAWQWVESAQYRLLRAGHIELSRVTFWSALVRPSADSWSATTTTSWQPRNTCRTRRATVHSPRDHVIAAPPTRRRWYSLQARDLLRPSGRLARRVCGRRRGRRWPGSPRRPATATNRA
jgi:hypothetical protein